MSPTFLELVVAVFLVWVAWQIGKLIAPRIVASFIAYWRNPLPPQDDPLTHAKNVTPPGSPGMSAPDPHGLRRK